MTVPLCRCLVYTQSHCKSASVTVASFCCSHYHNNTDGSLRVCLPFKGWMSFVFSGFHSHSDTHTHSANVHKILCAYLNTLELKFLQHSSTQTLVRHHHTPAESQWPLEFKIWLIVINRDYNWFQCGVTNQQTISAEKWVKRTGPDRRRHSLAPDTNHRL